LSTFLAWDAFGIENGPNTSQNGILLRTDIHTLYDKGYIIIDEDYHIEVSKRLKEDFGDGKMYYAYHGNDLFNIPDKQIDLPGKEYLRWHNENVYLG
jgi:putative restriction endonuclease